LPILYGLFENLETTHAPKPPPDTLRGPKQLFPPPNSAFGRFRPQKAGDTRRLVDFAGDERWNGPEGLPFCLDDYIELVDWSGYCPRGQARGSIWGSTVDSGSTGVCCYDLAQNDLPRPATAVSSRCWTRIGN